MSSDNSTGGVLRPAFDPDRFRRVLLRLNDSSSATPSEDHDHVDYASYFYGVEDGDYGDYYEDGGGNFNGSSVLVNGTGDPGGGGGGGLKQEFK